MMSWLQDIRLGFELLLSPHEITVQMMWWLLAFARVIVLQWLNLNSDITQLVKNLNEDPQPMISTESG